MKKIFKLKILWKMLGIIYFPIYIACWLLREIARFILAISYFGLLEVRMAKDIFKSLFKWHGRY